MADCLVRLGFAVVIISLISVALYAFSVPRAVAIEPSAGSVLTQK